jgi:hypothetical protein
MNATPFPPEEARKQFLGEIEVLRQRMAELVQKEHFLLRFRHEIEELGLVPTTCCQGYIDFDNPGRSDVVEILKRFGGEWHKELSFGHPDRIDYTREAEPGLKIRLYHAEPPPSCVVVTEDVLVPAVPEHTVKRIKLVCAEGA